MAVDGEGWVYVSDGSSHAVFRFETGAGIELLIGDQKDGIQEMGHPANETRIRAAGLVAVDTSGDLLYMDANTIRRIGGAAS